MNANDKLAILLKLTYQVKLEMLKVWELNRIWEVDTATWIKGVLADGFIGYDNRPTGEVEKCYGDMVNCIAELEIDSERIIDELFKLYTEATKI